MHDSTRRNQVVNVTQVELLKNLAIYVEITTIPSINPVYYIIDSWSEQASPLADAINILGRDDEVFTQAYQIEVLKKYVPILDQRTT